MKRSPMKRVGLARGGPIKRTKRMKPGKKKLAHDAAIKMAKDSYFLRFGWINEAGDLVARCQLSERLIYPHEAVAHHKTPRSELRKDKVADLDAPHRLLILHHATHSALHGYAMGRPTDPVLLERFVAVEQSEANADNGLPVFRRTM